MEQNDLVVAWFVLIGLACVIVALVVARGFLQDRPRVAVPTVLRESSLRRCQRTGCHAANETKARFCKRCGNALQL